MSADASHITVPDLTGTAAAVAMREAMRLGGVNLEDVGYINAHGTATIKGDIAETNAIKAVFGERARSVAVSSTKSMIGHLLGASGGVEMVVTCLSVAEGRVHPTINQFEPDPECDLDYVPNEARELEVKVALSNSFGFGGHNATVAVRKLSD
jgi:3-oxoacyl-[acyl-carrier-protein] synthase II